VAPVARLPRRSRDHVRRDLGLPPDRRAVLVTMGGVGWDYAGLLAGGGPGLPGRVVLVVPGGAERPRELPWARLLPFHSSFYHPDLVAASDAVVGKLGYSTLAECWGSGVPFGYVPRAGFAESPVLAAAVELAGAGLAVAPESLWASSWAWLEELLALPRPSAGRPRGNAAAADAITGWLASS
jgi:UDP:flavonoid glycosyltransferase YjiC (YdhE family)